MATEHKSKILLVDDDAFTLELMKGLLEKEGYAVINAKNGSDALEILSVEGADLALLDINMPGMSGLELAQHLKSETDVSFMFLSGVTDEDIVRRAAEYGAIGYLVKPVDIVKLVPTLETGLARAAELKALKKSEHKLSSALAAGRETSMAVGVLIARYQTNRQQAFEMLRSHARSNRKTIQEVANAILDAEESLNQFRPPSDTQTNAMRAGQQVARQIDKER